MLDINQAVEEISRDNTREATFLIRGQKKIFGEHSR